MTAAETPAERRKRMNQHTLRIARAARTGTVEERKKAERDFRTAKAQDMMAAAAELLRMNDAG